MGCLPDVTATMGAGSHDVRRRQPAARATPLYAAGTGSMQATAKGLLACRRSG